MHPLLVVFLTLISFFALLFAVYYFFFAEYDCKDKKCQKNLFFKGNYKDKKSCESSCK